MTFDCDICGRACATPQGLSAHRGSNRCLTNVPQGSTSSAPQGSTSSAPQGSTSSAPQESTSSAAQQPVLLSQPEPQPQQSAQENQTIEWAIRYVNCELAWVNDNRNLGVNRNLVALERVDGRSDKLIGTIKGPTGTAYEGGLFSIGVGIPAGYPSRPPRIHFITKIWHPNVCLNTGYISGELSEKDWTAAMTVRDLLLSVYTLLSTPVLADDKIADSAVAVQFTADRSLFDRTARYWAQVHASAPGNEPDLDDKVVNMVEMGFSQHAALQALSETWWNATQAVEKLALRVRLSSCSQFALSG